MLPVIQNQYLFIFRFLPKIYLVCIIFFSFQNKVEMFLMKASLVTANQSNSMNTDAGASDVLWCELCENVVDDVAIVEWIKYFTR